MLEQTLELLDRGALSESVERAMVKPPLTKPEDHLGGRATDMFELMLTTGEANTVHELVIEAVAEGKTTSGTLNRGLGGFCEAWDEYRQFLSDSPS